MPAPALTVRPRRFRAAHTRDARKAARAETSERLLSPFVSQKLAMLTTSENAEGLVALRQLVESGKIVPTIDRTYPLSETAAAIRYVQEGRARGKIVIAG